MANLGFALLFCGFGAVVTLVGGVIIRRSYQRRQRAAEIKSVDRTPIADLEPESGFVELRGTAQADSGTVEAPLAGTDGVLVETQITEQAGHLTDEHQHTPTEPAETGLDAEKYDERWRTVHHEFESVPFYLRDDTGEVLVDVSDLSSVTFETEDSVRVDDDETPPTRVQNLLEGVPEVDEAETDRRYDQAVVEPGENLYVLAEVDAESGEMVVRDDDQPEEFVVSDSSKETVSSHEAAGSIIGYVMGSIIGLVGLGLITVGLAIL